MKYPFKIRRFFLTAVALVAALIGYLYWNNHAIGCTTISIPAKDLPKEFDGLRIAHISDLHNTTFGPNHRNLLNKLSNTNPDLIFITGDLIDSRRTDLASAISFAQGSVNIATTYYVPGNHESRIEEYPQLRQALIDMGVIVLEDDQVSLTRDHASVSILGLRDPDFGSFSTALSTLTKQLSDYTLLLCHRPEKFEDYVHSNVNLVFTGHAHGGQIRIPFLGGLIAPHQGYFPNYTSGLHSQNNTHMIVSRGLGNSLFPFRINNPPEIVLAILQAQ